MNYLVQFADLPWPKVILGGVLALGLMFAVFYDDGSKLNQDLIARKAKVGEAEAILQKTQKAMADADRFEKQVQELAKEFERINEYMPQRMSAALLTSVLTEQALRSGVRLLQVSPKGNEQKQFPFYDATSADFELEGSFVQIATFLSYISRVPLLLTFDKVEMTGIKSDAQQEKSHIHFKATIYGYRYIKEDGAKSDTKGAGGAS